MKHLFLLLLTFFCCCQLAAAQTGTLAGTVTDKVTNEPVVGATVFIKGGNKVTATDIEGKYSIGLQAGIYSISVSIISYKQTTYNNIKIEPGQTTTLDSKIEENAAHELGEVAIIGVRRTNTEMAMLDNIRKSELVISGISGQQMAKSLDRDAAETVKRIPGVSIINNRFIMVRGLSERYNTVMLNDALTPSSEVDVKAFSFDVLPTSVIDRIMIYKSGAPELPGDFAGGVIKVYTKNFSNENTTNLSLSTSYRGGTTFQDFYHYKGSKTDALGYDNGTRSLPKEFPDNLNQLANNPAMLTYLGRSLANDWVPLLTAATPDGRFSVGFTRKIELGNIKLSNITSAAYSNTRQTLEIERNRYESYNPQTQKSDLQYCYADRQYSQNVRLGLLHNWGLSINERNKIEFRNLFNQLGSNQVTIRNGYEVRNDYEVQNYSLRYESRTLYSGQIHGTHESANNHTRFTWTTGYNYTNRNEPDFRRVRTTRATGSDQPYQVAVQFTADPLNAGRFYATMHETTKTASGMAEHTLYGADSTKTRLPKIRGGFYTEHKVRNFSARWMSYVKTGVVDLDILSQPLDLIFRPENIREENGFKLEEATNPSDRYEASNLLTAAFAGGTLPLGIKLNLAGGLRIEHNLQQLNSGTFGGEDISVKHPVTSLLPSLNLTYNTNEKTLLRTAYYKTLNRPEFRELAPFTYYNFDENTEERGNSNLQTATIQNIDLRYEHYPSATEMVSAGVFYKHFRNPIERVFERTNMGNAFNFQNAEQAISYGAEAEIRKSLEGLTANPYLKNLSVVVNASLIKSQVKLGNDSSLYQQNRRPMMGQSPYLLNAGLYYQTDGWQVNLLYNVVGRRIVTVGNDQNPTIYEMPRNVVDLAITKNIGSQLQIKAGVQDLFNQQVRLVQDADQNNKITKTDENITRFKRGQYTSFGITYTF